MLDLDTLNFKDFKDSAREMLPKKTTFILVEGNNKIFYQNISELFNCHVDGGGSCIDIKKSVEKKLILGEKNYIGIIDKDYNELSPQNIFMLDFYSIENIALCYMPQFNDLKIHINNFFHSVSLSMMSTQLLLGDFSFDKHTKIHSPFNLTLGSNIHSNYHSYLNRTILDYDSFIKYQNLKRVIQKYTKYYNQTNDDKSLRKYFNILHSYLPNNSLEYILINNHYKSIVKVL